MLCQENGATEVVGLPLSGAGRIAEEVVVATVASERVLDSLTAELRRYFKGAQQRPAHAIPRHDRSGWVVVDCGAVVVHLMLRELRAHYQLESLYTIA